MDVRYDDSPKQPTADDVGIGETCVTKINPDSNNVFYLLRINHQSHPNQPRKVAFVDLEDGDIRWLDCNTPVQPTESTCRMENSDD